MKKNIGLITALAFSFALGQSAFASMSDTTTPNTTTNSTSMPDQPATSDQSNTSTSDTSSQTSTTSTDHDMKCSCSEMMKGMIAKLNLDEAQKTKIKAIRDEFKSSQKDNMDQMKDLRKQIQQLIQSDTLDQAKLDTLINKKKELLGLIMKAGITAKHQIYTVLKSEQRTQYQQMLEQLAQHWEDCHNQED